MMDDDFGEFYFDPGQEEGSNFKLIPAGEYTAEIIDATITQPSTGDGHMLVLIWKIVTGDYEGRQVWQYLCFQHSKLKTQDIARRRIKDLCVALHIAEQVRDPEVFKFKPVRVRIGIKSDESGQYDDSNLIKRILPLKESDSESVEAKSSTTKAQSNGNKPTTAASKSSEASKPPGGAPGAAPWKKQPKQQPPL